MKLMLTATMFAATVMFSYAGPWDVPEIRALGMIESAERDTIIGKRGEVSRYQITPKIWKYYSKEYNVAHWGDYKYAATIAYMVYTDMRKTLTLTLRRQPTDTEMYIMYNCGYGYFAKHDFAFTRIPWKLRERAMRYNNLVLLYKTQN